MQKEDKERVVSELTDKLRNAETLIVADYRGLTMPQIDALRGKLIENGARLSVVGPTRGRGRSGSLHSCCRLAHCTKLRTAPPESRNISKRAPTPVALSTSRHNAPAFANFIAPPIR